MSEMTSDAEAASIEAAPKAARVAAKVAKWTDAMERIGEDDGYLEAIGSKHLAFFAEDKATLLVTFETAASIQAAATEEEGAVPLGYRIAREREWSNLCLISDGDTWYRDPAVFGYIDRLVDDAFFEDFDRVLFYGVGMGAYAAAAFSVAAPGARVLAISPRATLDPAVAGWDKRDPAARKLNFTDRYGFGPDMTEGTDKVWVVYDPTCEEDAMHAALYRRAHITSLRAFHGGDGIGATLNDSQELIGLIDHAMAGTLTPSIFAKAWRSRRENLPYLRSLLQNVSERGRTGLEIRILRSVTRRMRAPRLAKRLAMLTGTTETGASDRTASEPCGAQPGA
jgi:hypothetical protein